MVTLSTTLSSRLPTLELGPEPGWLAADGEAEAGTGDGGLLLAATTGRSQEENGQLEGAETRGLAPL